MKKIIGLFLVVLLSTVSAFAHRKHHGVKHGKQGDATKYWEKVTKDLNLDEKQTADFRKIHEDYKQKMQKERDEMKEDRQKHQTKMLAMRNERKEEIKKVLTDEQYQKYLEKANNRGERKGGKFKGESRKEKRSK